MTTAWLDIGLTTSTATSVTTTTVIIHHSSLRQAKILLPQQSSFGRCLNHQPRRDGKPTRNYVPFSSVLRCSRPKAPRLDDAGLSLTSPHRRCHVRRKLWSTQSNRKRGRSPHSCTTASATTTTRAKSSMRARGIRRMVPAVATTLARAATTIAGRTGAHHLNPLDRGSLARTFTTCRSWRGSGNPPTSPSTLGKQTPSSGLMTIALPAS
jgi:hypothetical protein